MKKFIYIISVIATIGVITSCNKDLDTLPIDPNVITSVSLFDNSDSYKQVLAKLYAGLSLSGQQGPHGNPDIEGIDEGFSTYLRQYWCAQELTTDEAVIGWNDAGLRDYHNMNWGSSNQFITAMYNRIYYQVAMCNEYIRQVKPRLETMDATLKADVLHYLAEARFLRAFSYYHALDMFKNVPFVTENDKVETFFPGKISRLDLFNFIESELKDIDADLVDAKNEYGRVDKIAAYFLLAKMYLNAKVYIGQEKFTDCLTYVKKVIASPYKLDTVYRNIFLADNNNSPEIIFSAGFDGTHCQSWGGMTFIIHSAVGGDMPALDFGLDGGWGGTRTTRAFVEKFSDITGATDKRAMFYTNGQKLDIEDVGLFSNGYAITKFKNVTSTGAAGSNLTYVDTDFPIFRLADAYLMYAEAFLRGASGADTATAVGYVNDLRSRAYGNTSGNISKTELTLNFILDERARELYWEGTRRTDLIRFEKFTGNSYLWPWKGGVIEGTTVAEKYNIFPIPSSDITANHKL